MGLVIKVKTQQNGQGEDDLENLESAFQALVRQFKVERRRLRKNEAGAREPGPKFRFYSTPIYVGAYAFGKVKVLDEFGD